MTLSDYLRFVSFAWFAVASIGGNLYLFNLIRRKRHDKLRQLPVFQKTEIKQQHNGRVPVRPAPRGR